VAVTSPWTDAGDPSSLLAANLAWLSERGLDGFVAEGADVVRTVQVRGSLVGANARVLGEGRLERCVVCPGATATAPLRDAIVTPSGLVIDVHV
jgi:mannose-1-phosphate guanylyltransferase